MANVELKTVSGIKQGPPCFDDLKVGDLFRYPGPVGSNYYMKVRRFSERTAYALCLPEGVFYSATASKEVLPLTDTQVIEIRNVA